MQFCLNVLKQMFYDFFIDILCLINTIFIIYNFFFIKFLFIFLKSTRIHVYMLFTNIFMYHLVCILHISTTTNAEGRQPTRSPSSQPPGDDERALHTNRPT